MDMEYILLIPLYVMATIHNIMSTYHIRQTSLCEIEEDVGIRQFRRCSAVFICDGNPSILALFNICHSLNIYAFSLFPKGGIAERGVLPPIRRAKEKLADATKEDFSKAFFLIIDRKEFRKMRDDSMYRDYVKGRHIPTLYQLLSILSSQGKTVYEFFYCLEEVVAERKGYVIPPEEDVKIEIYGSENSLQIKTQIKQLIKVEDLTETKLRSMLHLHSRFFSVGATYDTTIQDIDPSILTFVNVCHALSVPSYSLFARGEEKDEIGQAVIANEDLGTVTEQDIANSLKEVLNKTKFASMWGYTLYYLYTGKSDRIVIPSLYHLKKILSYQGTSLYEFFYRLELRVRQRLAKNKYHRELYKRKKEEKK